MTDTTLLPERSALIELVEECLTSVYICTRVWEAWQVGTMSESDFVEARGSDLAPDIADAVLSHLRDSLPSPSVHRQASAEPTDLCPGCHGSGEQQFMTQHLGPNDYEVAGQCSKCGGTGATKSRQASAGQEGVTDEQIEQIATIAHAEGRLPWAGFKTDANGFYTVPVISGSHSALVRAVLRALSTAAPESKEPSADDKRDAERYRFLRNKADPDNDEPYITVSRTNDWGKSFNSWETGDEADAVIDALLALPAAPTAGETL